MLKVVGASWHKTRISTYILMGAGFLAIGAFFIAEMDRPQLMGIYCATVFWSEKTGFQVEYWKQRNDLANIPKGVARTCYKDSIHQNGWSQLEIETQRNYHDWVQAYAAGILEGTMTWNNIYNQWQNTIAAPCDQDEDTQNFCTWLRDVIDDNYDMAKKKAAKYSNHDYYWHQIRLFYYQLEGLENGWIRGASRARSGLEGSIPFVDFLVMNFVSDIHDLKMYFMNLTRSNSNEQKSLQKNFNVGRALMLMKLFKTSSGNWRLLFGHSAAGTYSSMLRIQKRYKFRYHFTAINQKSHSIPATDISFTGYPGILASTDDFYVIKGHKLHTIIAGVALKSNSTDVTNINLKNLIPLTARIMSANRLAQNRIAWAKFMSYHTFTGPKQWLQINLRKIDQLQIVTSKINDINLQTIPINDNNNVSDVIWLAEQFSNQIKTIDITNKVILNGTGHFFNGSPYIKNFSEILEFSVTTNNFNENVTNEIQNMTTLDEFEIFLRNHAFRGDLLEYKTIPFGNIDLKLFSHESFLDGYGAVSGPLFILKENHKINIENDLDQLEVISNNENELKIIADAKTARIMRDDIKAIVMQKNYQHVPFKWSDMKISIKGIQHNGHPDEWNFDKVSLNWAWQE